jgi:hypothetical protein
VDLDQSISRDFSERAVAVRGDLERAGAELPLCRLGGRAKVGWGIWLGNFAMLKRMLPLAVVAVLAGVGTSAGAADLAVPAGVAGVGRPVCGTCGCQRVFYVRHRALESTYGVGYDPRNDDQTEPHYYFGRVRYYPRYFC